jgi:hypothetical protein
MPIEVERRRIKGPVKATHAGKGVLTSIEDVAKTNFKFHAHSKLKGKAGVCEPNRIRQQAKRKLNLITPANIDHRSDAYRNYARIIRGITTDLGGHERLSAIEKTLIDAYGALAVRMYDYAARQILGQPIEFGNLAQAVGGMVRIGKRLGVDRRPKEIVPLASYLTQNGDTQDAEIINGDAAVIDEASDDD